MNELAPVCEWARILLLPPNLSLRLSYLSLVTWPVAPQAADSIEYITILLCVLQLFCDEIGGAISRQVGCFEFALSDAVAMVSRTSGVRLIVTDRQSRRIFVCQRAADIQYLTFTTGGEPVALLSKEFGESCESIGLASQTLARLFQLYLNDPRSLDFISDLVRSTVHVYEKHADTSSLRLQQLAPALACKAPEGFDPGDIFACVSALYIGLGVVQDGAPQRLRDLLVVVDQAIARCYQPRTSHLGRVIDL